MLLCSSRPAITTTAQKPSDASPFTYTTSYENSGNWSGYFVGSGSGGGLKGVQGDWIDERPVCPGIKDTSLADFNTTSWSNVLTQLNLNGAGWGNPNNYVNTQVLMYDDGFQNYLAYPDGLSVNSNNTFTDRWYSYGNSYGSCPA